MQQLRGSHFQLGQTDQKNQFTSIMKMNFQGDQISNQNDNGEKFNLKGVHFQLGESKPLYRTTFKSDFQGKQIGEPVNQNQDKKNDLRTNHFVLGHQQAQQVSVTKATYNEKPLQPGLQNEQEIQKNRMRSHNHNFEETTHKIMQTNYNQQYQPQQLEPKQNLAERASQLRVSNIFLGKEQLPMITTQKEYHNKKEGERQASYKIGLQLNNINLGKAIPEYQTINKEYYQRYDVTQNPFAEENRQHLRATHFILGKDNQPYSSETQAHYRMYSENNVQFTNNTSALQESHFTIGDPRFLNHKTQTSYTSTMKPPEQLLNYQAHDQQRDRGSHFQIGSENIRYKSEMQSNFNNSSGQAAQLSDKQLNNLRSSHFGFNDNSGKNTFVTTKQIDALNYQQGYPNKLDPLASANLRSHHFTLGQNRGDLISQTHDIHRYLNGKPNVLNQQQSNNLRKHHFVLS